MINKLKFIVATLLLSVGLVESVQASGSMSCGTHLVTAGEFSGPGMYEVLKKCGEPDERYGDTWVYRKSSSVAKVLIFTKEGRLKRIDNN